MGNIKVKIRNRKVKMRNMKVKMENMRVKMRTGVASQLADPLRLWRRLRPTNPLSEPPLPPHHGLFLPQLFHIIILRSFPPDHPFRCFDIVQLQTNGCKNRNVSLWEMYCKDKMWECILGKCIASIEQLYYLLLPPTLFIVPRLLPTLIF